MWHPGFVDASGNLRVHIDRLRKRMHAHLGQDHVRTVRGVGYLLEPR